MNWRPYGPLFDCAFYRLPYQLMRRWHVPNQSWRETSNFRLIVDGADAFQDSASRLEPVYRHTIPILWVDTSTVGITRLLEAAVNNKRLPLAAMWGNPNAYLVQETCLDSGGGRGEYRTTFSAIAKRLSNVRRRVTKTTPIVPRTAMRSFIVLLLIHLFLVLARAVPVSKTLSAKGFYPHPLVVLFS